MAITDEQRELLNRYPLGAVLKMPLGDLIRDAESVVASEIALASGKVLVGNGSGIAEARTLSGDVTVSNAGVSTIAALAVTSGKLGADAVVDASKIADAAVSLEHLDSGITMSHRVVAAGKFTTLGGDANEQVTGLTGVVATDIVLASLQDKGGTPRTILTAKAGTAVIDLVFSGDPSTDHIVCYTVLRAAS